MTQEELAVIEDQNERLLALESIAIEYYEKSQQKRPEYLVIFGFVIVTLILLIFSFGPVLIIAVFGPDTITAATESTLSSIGSQILPIWAGLTGAITGQQLQKGQMAS